MSSTRPHIEPFDNTARGIVHGLSAAAGLRIVIAPGETPRTDLKDRLIVPPPANPLDPASLQSWHGMLDHETAHVLYSQSDHRGDPRAGMDATEKSAHNALEDCRINAKIAANYKGSGANLAATYRELRSMTNPEALDHMDATTALQCGAQAGVQPQLIDPAWFAPNPANNPKSAAAYAAGVAWGEKNRARVIDAPDVYAIGDLARELLATQPKAEEQEQEPGDESSEGEGDDSSDGESSDGAEGKDKGTPSDKPADRSKDMEQPKDGKTAPGKPAPGKPSETPPPPSPTDIGRVSKRNADETEKKREDGEVSGEQVLPARIDDKGVAVSRFDKYLEGGEHRTGARRMGPLADARQAFDRLAGLGRGLAADLRVAVQTRTLRRRVGEQSEGPALDESTLADIARGAPDVRAFESVTRGSYPDTAIVLCVDGSGSMREWDTPGSRWSAAMGAAAALSVGLAIVPRTSLLVWGCWYVNETSDSTALGDDGDGGTRYAYDHFHTPYISTAKGWNQRATVDRMRAHWLATAPCGNCECWGQMIRESTRALLTRPVSRRIVVLVTDGDLTRMDLPGRTPSGVSDVTIADSEAAARGVEVYGVAFGAQANWRGTLPKVRTIESRDMKEPTQPWLRAVSRLLLKGAR